MTRKIDFPGHFATPRKYAGLHPNPREAQVDAQLRAASHEGDLDAAAVYGMRAGAMALGESWPPEVEAAVMSGARTAERLDNPHSEPASGAFLYGWRQPYSAPRSPVEVALCWATLQQARARMYQVMAREFPHGASVVVVHKRGAFAATVVSVGPELCTVTVAGAKTRKQSTWPAYCVQRDTQA